MNNIVDTYEIATMGQNLSNTFTLASNGILIDILVEDLVPGIIRKKGKAPGGYFEEEVDRKKITVTVTVQGRKYTESVIVEDKPNLKAKDIEVKYMEDDSKPRIRISFDM